MEQGYLTHKEFRESVAPFKDEWGCVSIVRNPEPGGDNIGDGNLLLYTGLYYTALATAGALTQVDMHEWREILRRCKHDSFNMYWRNPIKKNEDDNQEHDDYWLILATNFHAVAGDLNLGIFQYGDKYGWNFDIQNPGEVSLKYYFGRFLNFVPFVRLCSAMSVELKQWGILYGSAILDCIFHGSSSDRIRSYARLSVLKRRGGLLGAITADLWASIMKRKFGVLGRAFEGEIPEGHALLEIDWI